MIKKLKTLKAMLVIAFTLLAPGALVVGVGCSGGCGIFQGAPIATNADPVVVYAQRFQNQALDTFDEFLSFEHKNRALLNDPAIKAAADKIRADYKKWDDDLSSAIRAYQVTRSQSDADKIDITLKLIHEAVGIARHYLITKAATIKP